MDRRQNLSGLNGQTPKEFMPEWQTFTDLSQEQIAAFQAMPEDLHKYIAAKRWQKEMTNISIPDNAANKKLRGLQVAMSEVSQSKVAGLKQAIDAGVISGDVQFSALNGVRQLGAKDVGDLYAHVVKYVQESYAIAADLHQKVDAGKIKGRAAVDAAFNALK